MLACQTGQMDIVKKRADQQQEKETIENEERLERDFESNLTAVKTRQEVEMAKLLRAQEALKQRYEAAKNFDLRIANQRIRKLEFEMEATNDPEKVWLRYHRTESGKLGRRAKARSERGLAKREFHVQDFSSLRLPPLKEPHSARLRKQNLINSARAPERPKYPW